MYLNEEKEINKTYFVVRENLLFQIHRLTFYKGETMILKKKNPNDKRL